MAELKIAHYVEAGVPVLKLEGQLRIGESSMTLRKAVADYLGTGTPKGLIIELGSVYYADSSGIGEIFSALTNGNKIGCRVVYANLNQKLIDLLMITHLITALDVYSSVKEAAASFK